MGNKVKKGLIGGLVLAVVAGAATFIVNKVRGNNAAEETEEAPKVKVEKEDFTKMTVDEYIEKYGKPEITKVITLKDGSIQYYSGDPENILGKDDIESMHDPEENDIRNAVQEQLNIINSADEN